MTGQDDARPGIRLPSDQWPELLGEQVRAERTRVFSSVEAAAREAGMSPTTWRAIELGRTVRRSNYRKVDAALGWATGMASWLVSEMFPRGWTVSQWHTSPTMGRVAMLQKPNPDKPRSILMKRGVPPEATAGAARQIQSTIGEMVPGMVFSAEGFQYVPGNMEWLDGVDTKDLILAAAARLDGVGTEAADAAVKFLKVVLLELIGHDLQAAMKKQEMDLRNAGLELTEEHVSAHMDDLDWVFGSYRGDDA